MSIENLIYFIAFNSLITTLLICLSSWSGDVRHRKLIKDAAEGRLPLYISKEAEAKAVADILYQIESGSIENKVIYYISGDKAKDTAQLLAQICNDMTDGHKDPSKNPVQGANNNNTKAEKCAKFNGGI